MASQQNKQQASDMSASETSRTGKSFDYYDYYEPGYNSNHRSISRRQLFLGGDSAAKSKDTKLATSASNTYGSFGGHGSSYDCDNGISIGLLLTALLGIGVMFFTLFTKITMLTGRRKKRSVDERLADKGSEGLGDLINEFHDIVYGGRVFI